MNDKFKEMAVEYSQSTERDKYAPAPTGVRNAGGYFGFMHGVEAATKEYKDQLEFMQRELDKNKDAIKALNTIGMMAKSGIAYTKDFTTEVEQIVRDALKIQSRWPY